MSKNKKFTKSKKLVAVRDFFVCVSCHKAQEANFSVFSHNKTKFPGECKYC